MRNDTDHDCFRVNTRAILPSPLANAGITPSGEERGAVVSGDGGHSLAWDELCFASLLCSSFPAAVRGENDRPSQSSGGVAERSLDASLAHGARHTVGDRPMTELGRVRRDLEREPGVCGGGGIWSEAKGFRASPVPFSQPSRLELKIPQGESGGVKVEARD